MREEKKVHSSNSAGFGCYLSCHQWLQTVEGFYSDIIQIHDAKLVCDPGLMGISGLFGKFVL